MCASLTAGLKDIWRSLFKVSCHYCTEPELLLLVILAVSPNTQKRLEGSLVLSSLLLYDLCNLLLCEMYDRFVQFPFTITITLELIKHQYSSLNTMHNIPFDHVEFDTTPKPKSGRRAIKKRITDSDLSTETRMLMKRNVVTSRR